LKKNGLKERQAEAILYTKKYGEITNSKYQEIADVSKATTTRDIKELEDKGILKNRIKGIECGIQTGSWLTMGS